MIDYSQGSWGVSYVFQTRGSVLQKALVWAMPSGALAMVFHIFINTSIFAPPPSVSQAWAGYNTVLGFLIIFRAQQSYARYWEGATLLHQMRGEWYNAASSLIAFCSRDTTRTREVVAFQHALVRLMSLLYCTALQQVCDMKDENFEVISLQGFEDRSLTYLGSKSERCEVILQWMQRLVVEGADSGALSVPPPILSRAFQELSRGMVNLINVRKIAEIQMPFPYVQLSSIMLMLQALLMPLISALIMDSVYWAFVISFLTVLSYWSINYIAMEMENPFGDDDNDLNIAGMLHDMNKSLWTLLEYRAQKTPYFEFDSTTHIAFSITRWDGNSFSIHSEDELLSDLQVGAIDAKNSNRSNGRGRNGTFSAKRRFVSIRTSQNADDRSIADLGPTANKYRATSWLTSFAKTTEPPDKIRLPSLTLHPAFPSDEDDRLRRQSSLESRQSFESLESRQSLESSGSGASCRMTTRVTLDSELNPTLSSQSSASKSPSVQGDGILSTRSRSNDSGRAKKVRLYASSESSENEVNNYEYTI